MKCPALALAALALATRLALAADPAEVSIYLFDDVTPVADVEVLVDGKLLGRTSEAGAIALTLPAGARTVVLRRGSEELLNLPLELQEKENAQLIATLQPNAAPRVVIESSHRDGSAAIGAPQPEAAGPPGQLSGRIINTENGTPIANARVYVSGTPLDIVTDAEGNFSAELPSGDYSISIIAANFSTLTLDGVKITAGETTQRPIELTPAGFELPEFVVLEPFVEGSLAAFVEEKRSSSAVADILGAEQISRAGDSDAAGALKRVTGLTLVDGKFVYVRGLGERYSSVLLNGAQIPSPDPTRRVVPLDLFPTEILQGIVVQKTYTADMPGEFGGGTIQLRTRGVPDSFLLRASLGIGYADGTTGEDGLTYAGGHRDWTGRDDGTREAPANLLGPALPSDPAELEALGEELAGRGFGVFERHIGANSSASFSVGDDFRFDDAGWSLGYIAAFRHSQSWDTRDEQRNGFSVLGNGTLIPLSAFERRKTERAIDAGLFFSTGLKIGEHHDIVGTAFQVRQTIDETQIDEGLLGSGNIERQFALEWVENELTTKQLGGEHSLVGLGGMVVSWQVTDSRAVRYSPFTREYGFSLDEEFGEFFYNGQNFIRFEDLVDDAGQGRFDLKWPWRFNDTDSLTLMAGVDKVERERRSSIERFAFRGGRVNNATDIRDVLLPDRIGPDRSQLRLQRSTLSTDAYTASQTLDAFYLSSDLVWGDWRVNLGVREERNDQEVITQPLFGSAGVPPVVGSIEATDRLPSGSVTWAYTEKAQLRLGYSRTVSRPDFREQSEAPFIDPQLDIRVQGNPDLKAAVVESRDLRWEYYFTPTESFSVAYFEKDFVNPIELVRIPASGELLGIRNAASATNRGVEFDLYKSLGEVSAINWLPGWLKGLPWADLYIGGNYAYIDSEIDLGDNQGTQTNARRPLQGQSPYVGNLSLSYLHPEGDVEATLLYNVSGERISQVGDSGVPDIYEQPLKQLDFTLSSQLPWEGWKAKLRLRNILDPEARYSVGSETSRSFRKGREINLSVEWRY
ncbi:TonB-dependent receptor domain-containing protein [Pseudomarimonas salicorniae]|uniref:TonB-dependent receptor n=1 Tax=Pseudomarimonas salicorniae TaxID=2933270 RepID=A0ABT0GDW2_9GAMM|nr:TonB-dependent receptor [Lysobacter sp. CAU 1642]MCK7592532.1 TonB-dependent receptor [Lysobacter sp. CAU 1642]